MSDKDFIYVGGVPGAGKTTLCKRISEKIGNINYVSSGEIKRPEARRRYNIGLSQLDQEKSLEVNQWFFEKLYKRSSSGIYLVDTHYTYPSVENSFVKLCPESIAEEMGLFLLVETNPEDIVKRRIARGRKRDTVSLEFAKLELEIEREEAIRLSKKFNIPLIILKNEENLVSTIKIFSGILNP